MNKKSLVVFVFIFSIIIISMTFVSAGFFGDLWAKITGKPTEAYLDANKDFGTLSQFGCTGTNTATDCSSYPQMECESTPGGESHHHCKWVRTQCIAKPCSEIDDKYCESIPGCSWTENTKTCLDSDGGRWDYSNSGTVSLKDSGSLVKEKSDSCSGNVLTEYYCYEDSYGRVTMGSKTYDCSEEGKVCEGGECVGDVTCSETDSRVDYNNKGETCLNDNCKQDSCISDTELVEYYCFTNGKERSSKIYSCSVEGKVCEHGACVEETVSECTDSDGGKDIYVKGLAKEGSNGVEDKCVLKGTTNTFVSSCSADENCAVWEGYCNEQGYLRSEILDCPNGCVDGACVKENNTPCVEAGYKCTSAVRGCGHYEEKDLDCGAGIGVICCEEIPYCGDGVCFEHSIPGYGENETNCPEDCLGESSSVSLTTSNDLACNPNTQDCSGCEELFNVNTESFAMDSDNYDMVNTCMRVDNSNVVLENEDDVDFKIKSYSEGSSRAGILQVIQAMNSLSEIPYEENLLVVENIGSEDADEIYCPSYGMLGGKVSLDNCYCSFDGSLSSCDSLRGSVVENAINFSHEFFSGTPPGFKSLSTEPNYFEKGSFEWNGIIYEDYCNDAGYLLEYSLDSEDSLLSYFTSCGHQFGRDFICQDGACVLKSCNSNSDCSEGFTCKNNQCLFRNGESCKLDVHCKSGNCFEGECLSDLECFFTSGC